MFMSVCNAIHVFGTAGLHFVCSGNSYRISCVRANRTVSGGAQYRLGRRERDKKA